MERAQDRAQSPDPGRGTSASLAPSPSAAGATEATETDAVCAGPPLAPLSPLGHAAFEAPPLPPASPDPQSTTGPAELPAGPTGTPEKGLEVALAANETSSGQSPDTSAAATSNTPLSPSSPCHLGADGCSDPEMAKRASLLDDTADLGSDLFAEESSLGDVD